MDRPSQSWEVVADASETAGRDVGRLLLDAPFDELTETRNAQLATFTFSLLVTDAIERLGIEPTGVAGHSVGEYSALAASGAIGFEDSVRVVAERGEAMQAAADARPGVMNVISGCDADTVDIACRLADGEVWVANFNSAEETVIAGEAGAVGSGRRLGHRAGRPEGSPGSGGGRLSHPVHGSGPQPTAKNPDHRHLPRRRDSGHRQRRRPPAHGRRGLGAATVGPAGKPDPLAAEHHAPRWAAWNPGAEAERLFVELGPGDALSKMIRDTLPSVSTVAVSVPADLDRLVDAISGNTALHAYALGHQGEHLYVSERVVISPGAGIFQPADGTRARRRVRHRGRAPCSAPSAAARCDPRSRAA